MKKNLSDLYHNEILIFSPGEIADRISILDIKEQKVCSTAKAEASRLRIAMQRIVDYENLSKKKYHLLLMYFSLLKSINITLWDLEDIVRKAENGNLEAQACRKVTALRVEVKNHINDLFNAPHERKLYQ